MTCILPSTYPYSSRDGSWPCQGKRPLGDFRCDPGILGTGFVNDSGYGPVSSVNRLVRTRLLGCVGAGGEKPPATRLGILLTIVHIYNEFFTWAYNN